MKKGRWLVAGRRRLEKKKSASINSPGTLCHTKICQRRRIDVKSQVMLMKHESLLSGSLSPSRIVEQFVRLLFQEITFRRRQRMDDSFLQLKYEPGLFSRNGVFNHLGVCAYATRLSPLLTEIRRRKDPVLLDSGAGCGSEAILAALLGADVTGIDLAPFKTDCAVSRIPFYEEVGSHSLALRFLTANAIAHLRESPGYDIIWANEAVSHIHPAEIFFAAAHEGLRPGGVLIIADANALNPVARWRAMRIRGRAGWYVHRQRDLRMDVLLDEVAEERLFNSWSLPRLLRQAGFRVRHLYMHGFLGSFFLPSSWQSSPFLAAGLAAFQQGARNIPLIRRFGSSMTVVAQKGERP